MTLRATHNTQNPRKDQNLSLLSSKRSSFPLFKILNKRKPLSLAAHSMMKSDATMLRASPRLSLNESVRIARRMKLVPPAKSVTLSNLNQKAMAKKKSW